MLTLILSLACAPPIEAGAPIEKVAPPAVMPAPLQALALPVEDGRISQATDSVLQVDYPAGKDRDTLAKAWTSAFEAAGFKAGAPRVSDIAYVVDVERPAQMAWTLAVVKMGGNLEVHVNGRW